MINQVKQRDLLYSGKAKSIYLTDDPILCIQHFTDQATAFNGKKKADIPKKGFYNNQISAELFEYLEKKGVTTHFSKLLNGTDMLIKRVSIIPLEVVVRNVVAGSLSKRLGWKEGRSLPEPLVEWYYKSDDLGDPMLMEDHVLILGLTTKENLRVVKEKALGINELLRTYFEERKLLLVDFKLEFGFVDEQIVLADEISPDTCRIWDLETRKKLDKDRFRRDLGEIDSAYAEVYSRIVKLS